MQQSSLCPCTPTAFTHPSAPQVQAKRPTWTVGAKAALSLKRPAAAAPTAAPAAPAAPAAAAWKLDADEDADMIDDDELLTEEDKARPAAAAAATGAYVHACRHHTCVTVRGYL